MIAMPVSHRPEARQAERNDTDVLRGDGEAATLAELALVPWNP